MAAGAERPLARDLFIGDYVHGESGLEGPTLPDPRGEPLAQHAVDFLAERILASARPVTLVPVGPLTNVALLLARHPEAAANVERIVIMGGAIAEGNVTPAAEFNIYVDPEAAWRVFRSGVPVTMIGLDVTHRALMMPAHVDRLRASGEVGRFVAELHDFFVEYHKRTYGTEGAPIHDAVAVAHVLRPGLVETLHRHVDVDCESQLCRGRTVVDLWRRTGLEPNADVGVDIDAPAFLELLLRAHRVAPTGRGEPRQVTVCYLVVGARGAACRSGGAAREHGSHGAEEAFDARPPEVACACSQDEAQAAGAGTAAPRAARPRAALRRALPRVRHLAGGERRHRRDDDLRLAGRARRRSPARRTARCSSRSAPSWSPAPRSST